MVTVLVLCKQQPRRLRTNKAGRGCVLAFGLKSSTPHEEGFRSHFTLMASERSLTRLQLVGDDELLKKLC